MNPDEAVRALILFLAVVAGFLWIAEPRFWEWVGRGGPDYLDDPDGEESSSA